MSKMKRVTVDIVGMTCAACSKRVEDGLNRLEDVKAQVNLPQEKASIQFNPKKRSFSEIVNHIEQLGYSVVTKRTTFDIFGMTCTRCADRVERVLEKEEGIEQVQVNLSNETATVEFYTNIISSKKIIQRIGEIGFKAEERISSEHTESHREREIRSMRIKLIVAIILSLPLLITMLDHLFGITIPTILLNPWFQFILATPVQFIIGWQFYKGAYKSLRNGSANMDVLVALGTSTAYFYSLYESFLSIGDSTYEPHLYFETSAILITLILFGKYLETNAKSKTTVAIQELLNLQAKEARVLRNGKEEMIPIEKVVVGDRLIIKPGEKIPVDGIVIKGRTAVDESMITGESIPIEKEKDSLLIGATINENGTVEMEATKVGEDTALSSIVQAVEDAQLSKAPIQRMADIISGYFVPIVVGISILTFIIWISFVSPGNLEQALVTSIAVLVIACPCALGLATPTSIMVGTGKAAENGILFKGGEHLERTHQLDTIVFDKTGTITRGKPEVTNFSGDDTLLQYIASAENSSEHPLADAIVRFAEEKNIELLNVDSFSAIPGHGIEAEIDGKRILVGTRKLMNDEKINIQEVENELLNLESEGKTAMIASIDGQLSGVIAVADTLKDTAKEAIQQLKDDHLEVIMLTGDNERTAHAIAEEVGIDHVIAEVLPEEKAKTIEKLQKEGKNVAMVGDGINDAPALATANIGIAIGTGTEVAIEAADVTLLGGELLLIPKAIQMSHATIKNIRQNLFWAFAYNSAGIPIAAVGLLAPWVAGAAMAFSSVSVVLNALRLKAKKI